MRLLQFVDGDAPQTFATMHFDGQSLSFPNAPRRWVAVDNAPVTACYWLLDDEGRPVCQLNDVVVMKGEATSSLKPMIVTDEHLHGVDLRSKMGKMLESSRKEYGQTFKTSSAKAAVQMNAEQDKEKRQERSRRERAAVAETIEKGDALPVKKPRTEDASASKKSRKH